MLLKNSIVTIREVVRLEKPKINKFWTGRGEHTVVQLILSWEGPPWVQHNGPDVFKVLLWSTDTVQFT